MALSTVLTIFVIGHEAGSSTSLRRTFTAQTGDFSLSVNLVILQNSQLDLLANVRLLLGCGVGFLLFLLASSSQTKHQVQGGFLLDVVIGETAAV